ncbi:MAG: TM1812 family CRISPR-associated protein [Acutalibacteraceae bacterium]
MKKTIICNIPMKEKVDQVLYSSDDKSLPVSDRKVRYPICAFLEKTIKQEDELKVIILVKKDNYGHYARNTEYFKEELAEVNANIGAAIEYTLIDTDFEETRSVHEQLMGKIVDELAVGSRIIVDTTYGPKDLPIVIFAALNFAEKFLNCTVDNIVYGQASFVDGQTVDTKICDMIPLYYLGSITNTIHCTEPDKAKSMLKALLSL